MKILITGDKGFIATKLKEALIVQGHEVVGYDVVDGLDLLNRDMLESYIEKVDVVYHIAAEADLTRMQSLDAGYAGVMANVQATHNVAYLCSKYDKWLIYASTVCVYGNQEVHPETEDTTLPNPSELYACSKYAAEWIIKGYTKNFGNPYTILRFATIYGEGMRPALGMHIFISQALNGEPITVHGDGLQDRTLTYIHDLVEGIIAPLNHPEGARNQIFNLTAPQPISALKVAEDVKKAIPESPSEITHIEQRDNQTFHEDFSVMKAKELLGWEARTSWEEGLMRTISWLRSN